MKAARDRRRRAARGRVGRIHALAVLGLLGTGSLSFVNLGGVVRIRRGGVRLIDRIPRRRPEFLP
jgi:hypothetical protein